MYRSFVVYGIVVYGIEVNGIVVYGIEVNGIVVYGSFYCMLSILLTVND